MQILIYVFELSFFFCFKLITHVQIIGDWDTRLMRVCWRATVFMIMFAQQLIHTDYIEHRNVVDLLKSYMIQYDSMLFTLWCAQFSRRIPCCSAFAFFIAFLSYPFWVSYIPVFCLYKWRANARVLHTLTYRYCHTV